MEHKILFEITHLENKKTNPLAAEENADKLQPKKEKQEKEKNEKMAAAIAGMVVKRVGSEAASMVGDLTGNYYAQNQIDNISTAASYAMAIAMNPAVGLTALALNVGTSIVNERVSIAKQQQAIGYMRDLTGTTPIPQSDKYGRGV